MTSAFSSAGDRSSRFPGGDMALQNLKSLYAESPDLPIFTRAVSPCPPTAAASKTSAARTFAPITVVRYNRNSVPSSVSERVGRQCAMRCAPMSGREQVNIVEFPAGRLAIATFAERPELRAGVFEAEIQSAAPEFMRHDPTAALYYDD